MNKRVCKASGCNTLIDLQSAHCSAHARPVCNRYDDTRRRDDPALAQAASTRNSSRWRKVRELFRAHNPWCVNPLGLHGDAVVMQQVHHIQGLIHRPDLAFDLSNLAPLCTRCHRRIEALERAGEPTAQLFSKL
jgi:5-methylcytosine-specific restriction endonuclease McrA